MQHKNKVLILICGFAIFIFFSSCLLLAQVNKKTPSSFLFHDSNSKFQGINERQLFPLNNKMMKAENLFHKVAMSQYANGINDLIDTVIVQSTTDTTRYSYTYDNNGKMLSHTEENWRNGKWINDIRYTATYDINGNTLSFLCEYWDGIKWWSWYRHTSTYNSNGQPLSNLDETLQMVHFESTSDTTRHSYIYDNKGNPITDLIEKMENGIWVNYLRYTFTYDTNNRIISLLGEYCMGSQWMGWYRYTFTYDANGSPHQEYEELQSWTWENNRRDTYTYDEKGNQLSWLYEIWTDGQWVNSLLENYSYDSRGNRSSYLHEEWGNSQWVNSFRETYTYDSNMNRTSLLVEQWNNGQWMNYRLNTFTYTTNGKDLSQVVKYWIEGQWGYYGHLDYTYDAKDNVTYELEEYEKYSNRSTYTYNSNNKILSLFFEQWTDGQLTYTVRKAYTYDTYGNGILATSETMDNSIWKPRDTSLGFSGYDYWGYKISLHYKRDITDISNKTSEIPAVIQLNQNYPNPFNPRTSISYALPKNSHVIIKVYDLLGREVKTLVDEFKFAGHYSVFFDGDGLSSGIYIYNLISGDLSKVKKMVFLK